MAWDAGATTEGHGLASQTDDGEGIGDYRVIFVPAKKHPAGSKRPIYGLGNRYEASGGQQAGNFTPESRANQQVCVIPA